MRTTKAQPETRQWTPAASAAARIGALLVAAAGFTGCLKVNPTDGVLLCAAPPNACPSGYSCAPDQHCWKSPPLGGSGTDLAVNGGPGSDLSVDNIDGSVPTDASMMTTSADLSGTPVGSSDMAMPKPIVDMAVTPPDMTFVFNYCPAGTIFCDNFENDTIAINAAGNWSDTFVQPTPGGGQTLATGTTEHHDGTHALHAAANNSVDSWATIEYKLTTPATALSLRMFVWPTTTLNNRGEVARIFSRADTNNNGFQVGGSSNGKWFISDSLGGSADHESTVSVTTGAWTCLELVVPATGNVQLFINGSTTAAISFAPLNHEPYDTIHGGVEWAPAGVPVDVWVDQVALSSSRLPCP